MNITGYKGTGGNVIIPGTIGGRNVTSIGDFAFSGCTSINSIALPGSVNNIGFAALGGCSNLSSITVDESNSSYISTNGVLFSKDSKTLVQYPAGKTGTSYTIPNGVNIIDIYAFAECTSLNSITIPSSVNIIGHGAFEYCTSLSSIAIPNSVTVIANYAFAYCTSLNSIALPDSVNSIGHATFAYCTSLTSITVDAHNSSFVSSSGVLFSYDGKTLVQYPAGKTGTSYTIPNGVNIIGYASFASCTSLSSVTIPSSVHSIDYGAFEYCASLTSITFQGSTTSIGSSVFWGCPNSLIVRCYIGSTAQAYCITNDINYQLIVYTGIVSMLPSASVVTTAGPVFPTTSATPSTSIPTFRPISPIPLFPYFP